MSKLRPAPGPWGWIHVDGDLSKIVDANGTLFASCWEDRAGNANARLISMAPELLEALQALVNQCEREFTWCNNVPAFTASTAAIAKATGERDE